MGFAAICDDATNGPVVKWHNAAFALLRREFDSPRVHYVKN